MGENRVRRSLPLCINRGNLAQSLWLLPDQAFGLFTKFYDGLYLFYEHTYSFQRSMPDL